VRLEAEDAVHDVGAGFLQLGRNVDVRFFIEARAQFDDDGHVLACLRGLGERVDDGGIAAGAIQGLLDGEHLRVAGRLFDEIRNRPEALERVVQEHVPGPQRGEEIAAHAQTLGYARRDGVY